MRVKLLDTPHVADVHIQELLPVSAVANRTVRECQLNDRVSISQTLSSSTSMCRRPRNCALKKMCVWRCIAREQLTESGSWDVRDCAAFKGTKWSWTPAMTSTGRLVTHRTSSAALVLDKTPLVIEALLTSASALSHPSTCKGPCKPIVDFSISGYCRRLWAIYLHSNTPETSQQQGRKQTLYRSRVSEVSLEASCHARRVITCPISDRSSGRSMCRASDVCKSTLAKGGTTSCDKLTPTNTSPLTSTCIPTHNSNINSCSSKKIGDSSPCLFISNECTNFTEGEAQRTWMESLDFRALAAAMSASKPPSAWPTSTTDLNPNSWQNSKSRSTCVWRSYGFRNPLVSHSSLWGREVNPQPGRSKATTRHPTSLAMEPITWRQENTPPPNPWSSTTPVSFSCSNCWFDRLESPLDRKSKLSNIPEGCTWPAVCCKIVGHPLRLEEMANWGNELLSNGVCREAAVAGTLPIGFHVIGDCGTRFFNA